MAPTDPAPRAEDDAMTLSTPYTRRHRARWRHAARIFGCCRDCGAPAVTKAFCEPHRAAHAARERRLHHTRKAAVSALDDEQRRDRS